MDEYVQKLENENRYLKSLLDQTGIPYDVDSDIQPKKSEAEERTDRGARIISRTITGRDAKLFYSMFWGRTDVYSRRSVEKSTGEANYYLQCANFWKPTCPRIRGSKIKCRDCEMQAYNELKGEQIIAHLCGAAPDATDVIGIYPLLPDDTCRFLVFDFDNHEKDAVKLARRFGDALLKRVPNR